MFIEFYLKLCVFTGNPSIRAQECSATKADVAGATDSVILRDIESPMNIDISHGVSGRCWYSAVQRLFYTLLL